MPDTYYYGNYYLSEEQRTNNALYIYPILRDYGWTKESIAAICGNMYQESGINPGMWQGANTDRTGGYGLTQWTPASKVLIFLADNGYPETSMEGQLAMLQHEIELNESHDPNSQWIATNAYNISFLQFTQSTESVTWLTASFYYDYERPPASDTTLPLRQEKANYYYTIFDEPVPPDPPHPPMEKKKSKLWMYMRPSWADWR